MAGEKIGIFQYNGVIDINSFNLANILNKNDFDVSLITTQLCERNITNNYLNDKIKIIEVGPVTRLERILFLNLERLKHYSLSSGFTLINPLILWITKRKIAQLTFDYIIAIEKHGLIWVNKLPVSSKIIYYSLELYIADHPALLFSEMRMAASFEKKLHKKCVATIIQDQMRAEALYHENTISFSKMPAILLPVSVIGPKNITRFNYFHYKYKLKPSQKIVLYFGGGGYDRKLDFVKISNMLPPNHVLVVHGYRGLNNDNAADGNLFISHDFLDQEGIDVIIASADIGLVFYSNDSINNRLTAFASEKIARLCQCGIPFISLNNESYVQLRDTYKCCELVEDYDQVNEAIKVINLNYSMYSDAAFCAFEVYYNMAQVAKPLINFLRKTN